MADNYQVIGQKQNITINPTSTGFDDVWEVTFKVTSGPARGTVATVNVSNADHNAAYIGRAIADKIAQLDEVAAL